MISPRDAAGLLPFTLGGQLYHLIGESQQRTAVTNYRARIAWPTSDRIGAGIVATVIDLASEVLHLSYLYHGAVENSVPEMLFGVGLLGARVVIYSAVRQKRETLSLPPEETRSSESLSITRPFSELGNPGIDKRVPTMDHWYEDD